MKVTAVTVEHQLNRLIFDDIERFMSKRDVPEGLDAENLMSIPYLASISDIDIGFISLFRRTGSGSCVALVIQYTVKIGGAVVVTMIRNASDPAYGLFHYRQSEAPEDLNYLRATLQGPRDYRAMAPGEIEKFADDISGMAKTQIRIVPQ